MKKNVIRFLSICMAVLFTVIPLFSITATASEIETVKNNGWREIGPTINEGTSIIAFGDGKYVLVTKKDKKSTVYTGEYDGQEIIWTVSLNEAAEIDSVYYDGSSVYLAANKHGKIFYKSTDKGLSWENLLENATIPSAIGNKKIEGLFVEGESVYFLVGELGGIYSSTDSGKNWSQVFTSMIPNTTILTELDAEEVDRGFYNSQSNTVYLIGAKKSVGMYISTDGGYTWNAPITTTGLPAEKAEDFNVISENEMIAVISKYGIYKSVNGGVTWVELNGNLPKNPEKNTEYDARKLFYYNGMWYIGTKKQGILTSYDMNTWTAFKVTGLTDSAKDIWDISFDDDMIYIAGKGGLWKTSLLDDSPWMQVSGGVKESRAIITVEGSRYLITKDMEIYMENDSVMTFVTSLPVDLDGEDPKHVIYSNNYFYLGNKKGLVRYNSLNSEDISDFSVRLSTSSYTYDGAAKKPAVLIEGLSNGTDYTVSYSNNINVGTATVTITGQGNYTGTIIKTFTIKAKSISNFASSLKSTAYSYTGTARKPGVTLKDGNKILVNNTDYTVTYSANTNVGTAKVTIKGKGNYTGSINKTFTIKAKSLSGLSASLKSTAYVYTGTARKPGVTLKDGNKILINNTDYTVTYSANTNVGTAKVTIKGKGNYTGSITRTFTIKLDTPTITVTGGTRKAMVKFAKTNNVDGCQVQYSANKSFKKSTSEITKKSSYTITKLKKGTKYYVRVRSYKNDSNGKKVYSSWSDVKMVTIKN